ncbi:hypothetical protein [Nocardia carnea]|uniref:hypothetical protein n=1 Tax=Nocardia carnea TaxID=37328 RepID=UPI0024576481|nr:hypothetical protein [Nocardia carnea]
MGDGVDQGKLDSAVENLRTKIDEWKAVPDRINDTVDGLKFVAPAAWAYATGKRDEAQASISKLLEKLEEVMTGLDAPFTFLGWAADWQIVGATIRGASNAQGRSEISIEGYWTGEAKNSYVGMKTNQEKAFTTAVEICTKIETSLINLSQSALDFYTKLADELTTYMSALTAALVETASVVLIYDGAPGLVRAATDIVTLVEGLITAMLNTVRTQMVEANNLDNATDNPWGFYGDRWPDAVAKMYNNPAHWQPSRV